MNSEVLFKQQSQLIQMLAGGASRSALLDHFLQTLLSQSIAECGLFLARNSLNPLVLELSVVIGDSVLNCQRGEALDLPCEFSDIEEGVVALEGPQQGTILLDGQYHYGLLLPLGRCGCIVLLSSLNLELLNGDEVHEVLDSIGLLLEMAKTSVSVISEKDKKAELKIEGLAEQKNAAKSEFLTRMSHELRTPLNAILGFTQLFEFDENLTDIQIENLKEIEKAGYLMLELVSEVLDLAKIESGRIEIFMESVSLGDVLEECLSLISNQAARRHITITVAPECRLQYLHTDQIRLKQILLNLLTNAVKYNRDGGDIQVLCFTVSEGRCRIMVNDSGMGIMKGKIASLFQPFNRLGVDSAGIEGTGMGLVITKKLVELMGGGIGVESEIEKGSSFWFELDESPMSLGSISNEIPEKAISRKGLRILVVEDNLVNQDLLRQQLGLLGHDSDVVAHGRAAMGVLDQGGYHCILTDCNMPVMDGYTLAHEIRQKEQLGQSRIPIIAITANAGGEEERRCLASGMDALLSKPLDINALAQLLQKLVPNNDVEKVLPISTPPVDDSSEKLPIDTGFLANLVGNNQELQRRVLLKFLETTPTSIDEINAAIDEHNKTQLVFVAHRLKSSSRSMGGNALGDCCQYLEEAAKDCEWEKVASLRQALEVEWELLCNCFNAMSLLAKGSDDKARTLEGNSRENSVDDGELRLFILEDDPLIVEQLKLMLNALNIYSITYYHDGLAALQAIDNADSQFDIILCDLNLPGMDGIEFLRHLADREFAGGVVLMSGEELRILKSVGSLATAHKLNILATLQKPILVDVLGGAILKYKNRPVRRHSSPSGISSLNESQLIEGLEKGYVEVYFQPKLEVCSQQVVGVEALARWKDPDKGIIPPWAFIPVAEEVGLIDDLTYAVFDRAMQWGGYWRKQGIELKIAVNLSMDSLVRLDLPEYFVETALQHQMLPSMVTLEITESRLMSNITAVLEVLTRLRLKGMELSIDDFGTGYSTMEQLKKIPFSEFKIDRSFVHGATEDSAARAILESNVSLAKKLGMGIVAEGVENSDDWRLIETLGCDQAQGYFMSRPMPGDEFLTWLAQWDKSHHNEA